MKKKVLKVAAGIITAMVVISLAVYRAIYHDDAKSASGRRKA